MNRILLGVVLGAAGYCFYKKLQKEGYLDETFEDSASRFLSKSRRGIRNVVDKGQNQVEYLQERAEYGINKGKRKLDELRD